MSRRMDNHGNADTNSWGITGSIVFLLILIGVAILLRYIGPTVAQAIGLST